MLPVEAPCSREYRAYHTSGKRTVRTIRWIVLHDQESGTAESAARYFTLPESGGSAHLCVDDTTCFRCLDNTDVPWAAPGANEKGFHIEQAGFARWSAVVWRRHRMTLRRAAYKTALHCVSFGVRPVWLKAPDLRADRDGITSHAECTKAFGGDHTDPGPFWPRRLFMRYVREFHVQLARET